MTRRALLAALALTLGALAACHYFVGDALWCDTNAQCPDLFHCEDGRCAPGAPDAGLLDAGPDDAGV